MWNSSGVDIKFVFRCFFMAIIVILLLFMQAIAICFFFGWSGLTVEGEAL